MIKIHVYHPGHIRGIRCLVVSQPKHHLGQSEIMRSTFILVMNHSNLLVSRATSSYFRYWHTTLCQKTQLPKYSGCSKASGTPKNGTLIGQGKVHGLRPGYAPWSQHTLQWKNYIIQQFGQSKVVNHLS